jgi:glutamate-1-semialdehyde 2,1-aminomutase
MDSHLTTQFAVPVAVAVAAFAAFKLKRRLALSRAKHPSLAGHSKMSRRLARANPI